MFRRALILPVAATYFGAAKLGLTMAFVAEQVTPVWPPTGIALVVMWLDPRLWPGITLGAFLANVTVNEPVATACGIALGNTAEAALGAWLLRRIGFSASLGRLRDVLALLVLAGGVSTTVSATVGVASLCLGGVQPWSAFGSLWSVWWIGDAMGDLVVAPLLFVWTATPPARWRLHRVAEAAALVLLLIVITVVAFGPLGPGHSAKKYMAFPFVIWGALRFGQLGAVTVTFIASSLAIWSTVNGLDSPATSSPHQSLILLQVFMAVVAVTALLLAAAVNERNAADRGRALHYGRLQASEERLRLALDAGRMAVWDWNVLTGEIKWSASLASIRGRAPRRSSGNLAVFRELVHPEDRECVDRAIHRATVDEGADFDVEFRNGWPDGSIHWMACKGRMAHEAGRAVRMLGIATDVTERRRLEEELRRRACELAEADRRKDEFLAMLAHELRNSLAPICTVLELLRLRGGGTAVEQAHAVLERQTQHMVRLIDDLFDVSRITSGKITLQREPLELGGVVAAAVESMKPFLDSRGHELVTSLPPEPVWMEADAVRLAQIISNLLSNAAKFTERKGQVSLTAERVGNDIVLRVRDTGIGMTPDVVARAFDVFAQGAPTLHRSDGGLGIGLTLVRALVELHGGRVWAESEGPGRGSLFTLRLPALPPAPAPPAEKQTTGAGVQLSGDRTRRRVLVVDDNVDAAESLATLLGIDGHDVRVAYSGPEAVEVARAFAPDVVLLDIGLPGMDGCAVACALRADPTLRCASLIAVSGYGLEKDRRRTREAGFDHHLVKPVALDVLRALVAGPPAFDPPSPRVR